VSPAAGWTDGAGETLPVTETLNQWNARGAAVTIAARAVDVAECRDLLEMCGILAPPPPPAQEPGPLPPPAQHHQLVQAAEIYLQERAQGTQRLSRRIGEQLGYTGPDAEIDRLAKNIITRCRARGYLVQGGPSGGNLPGPKLLEARQEDGEDG
jgi:hypothetical protein